MRCIGMLMDGRAQLTSAPQAGDHSTMLLVINAARDAIAFTMPDCADGTAWTRLIDTSDANRPEKDFDVGDICPIPSRSLVLLRLVTSHPAPADVDGAEWDRG